MKKSNISLLCRSNYVVGIANDPFQLTCDSGTVTSRPVAIETIKEYGPIVANHVNTFNTDKLAFVHVATLWGLTVDQTYLILCDSETEGGWHKKFRITPELTPDLDPLKRRLYTALNSRSTVMDLECILRPDFTDCALVQGNEPFMATTPVDCGNLESFQPFAGSLLYHGLFFLPAKYPFGWLLHLPNPEDRYLVDFAALRAKEATCQKRPDWRRSKKVRKNIASGQCRLVVQDTPEALRQALERAEAYQIDMHHSTWLCPEGISILSSLAPSGVAEKSKKSVQVLVIDLVDANDNVLAGCCGFTLGSVYHDFTMYTQRRDRNGYGTFLTKLIAEALYTCGYDMWYWGLRVDYMAQYENGYGACTLPRSEFYRRWVQHRDIPLSEDIVTFVRSNKAMVPSA
ncbi:hypothetical protein ADEAN_000549700 [Angomonas deanei]|uniref:Uncharacterized protein n=1 Tax=Angomonas deanei TaxID=59799 RepID=A0A7G2CGC3_9TRYP|nr:hypothetical protein ADEAN_000549700 [Angomonas deanei]